jgi:hypothetical protein
MLSANAVLTVGINCLLFNSRKFERKSCLLEEIFVHLIMLDMPTYVYINQYLLICACYVNN